MPNRLVDRPRLVLASGSPRRRELLASVGVAAEIVVTDIDETVTPGEVAQDLVARLARGKAEAAASTGVFDNALIIGSDTVVEVDGVILGKPVDDEDATSMLRSLSGQTHRAHTGICVVSVDPDRPDQLGCVVSSTTVTMRHLSEEDIAWYLSTLDHQGKAGSYAIQGFAAVFVIGIEGPYDGVVGLPLQRLDQLLTEFGWPLRTFSQGSDLDG